VTVGVVIGIVIGVVVVVVLNHFWPAKIDKASKELAEEINDKLRGD
jgi:ABC-type phosphate transport system auxiliary subunit